jgi:hypothetical protein
VEGRGGNREEGGVVGESVGEKGDTRDEEEANEEGNRGKMREEYGSEGNEGLRE